MTESNHVLCHACGARFDRKAWLMLALVARIDPNEVKRVLADWPNEHCIEIRRCRRCAREIPLKRDAFVVEGSATASDAETCLTDRRSEAR